MRALAGLPLHVESVHKLASSCSQLVLSLLCNATQMMRLSKPMLQWKLHILTIVVPL